MNEDILRTALTRDAILLTGRKAVITGGGGGIGRGITLGLAEFGADVAIIDVNEADAEEVAEAVAEAVGVGCVHSGAQTPFSMPTETVNIPLTVEEYVLPVVPQQP